jgi:23S rRNA pseudouridine955/2504/2580 synthase
MNNLRKAPSGGSDSPPAGEVRYVDVGEEGAGQRLDNYLIRLCKGVPKSHIYRVIRSGEVRVNKGRAAADQRLEVGDRLRIPPLRMAERTGRPAVVPATFPVLYEDDAVLAIDKPAGVAVHGGSGVSFGVIEQLRAARPQAKFLELVHRLDRETSGILMLAKKRSALTALHAQIRDGAWDKRYLAAVFGNWTDQRRHVKLALTKWLTDSGERRVSVSPDGMASHTVFERLDGAGDCSLLEAQLKTGRTHQIRVHLAHLGFPIIGDEKYGDFARNRVTAKNGFKLMFLHAARLSFPHPITGAAMQLQAELPATHRAFWEALRHEA